MGASNSSTIATSQEKPGHLVTIENPFYLSQYEVTQGQWYAVMGTTIRDQWEKAKRQQSNNNLKLYGEGPDYPMYYVSWEEAAEFCRRLNDTYKANYRLPTEAEWEFAAGCAGKFSSYSSSSYTWYVGNSSGTYHPVGQKRPNTWGLYDMTGNVSEYCSDWYAPYRQDRMPELDPQGPDTGQYKVLRGGSIFSSRRDTRFTRRMSVEPGSIFYNGGFRIVLETPNDLQRIMRDWDEERGY
jgi:formylglycine-generating enzyme required for sulfatase activity